MSACVVDIGTGRTPGTYAPGALTQAVTAEVVERMSVRDVAPAELADLAGLGEIALRNRLEGRAPWTLVDIDRIAYALDCDPGDILLCRATK